MYHRVGAPLGPPITVALTVPTAVFAAQMRWLHRAGYQAITQEQLYAALELHGRLPRRPIVITFDDGYRDVLWNAAPVLYRLRMPATAYVITARASGRDPSFLTWPELRRLAADGFEIGSHTVHHVELTTVSPEAAWQELTASRRALERGLGRPVLWFSYPAGRFDHAVEQLVGKAGYLLAVTTRPGALQAQPLALHRYEVLDSTGVSGLKALLASKNR
jgi:peptidoglycan/xylan/chitin deacetylase (PgdA/CDA1 family)